MGLPGVGKTTVSRLLYRRIPLSQHVDGDDLWRIHPFEVNDANISLVEKNIQALHQAFLAHPDLTHFVFSWVIGNVALFERIQQWFRDSSPVFFWLDCDKEVYLKRCQDDQRDPAIFARYDAWMTQYKQMPLIRLDTTNQSPIELVEEIWTRLSQ
jgi:adenylate kinase family enzyme